MIVPGRILVIDDVPEEVVKVIDSLRQEGESVLFAPSMPEKDVFLENVRLLIIDLYLVGGDKEASYEAVVGILDKLSQKSRFFVIAIWTKYARNTDEDRQIIEDLKKIYEDRTKTALKAVFLEPFGKRIPQVELFERIKKSMAFHPECGLLFEIERSVEDARDRVVSDIVDTASIPVILRTLKEEIGDIALIRHVISMFLRILGRHCKPTDAMTQCVKDVIKKAPSIDADKYGHIHRLQSYYEIPKEELLWTGDILQRKNGNEEYAVVITPACDFAQRKKRPLDFMNIISATRINHGDLTDSERCDGIKTRFKIKASPKEVPRAILTGTYLQKRFYVLRYLRDSQTDDLFHLVLDFQRVYNLPFKETAESLEKGGWERLCRIDAPIIDNLLQTYSGYSSRIGVQAIPEDIVKAEIDKIKRRQPESQKS